MTEPACWYILGTESVRWDSDHGFAYTKCRHRKEGACLSCRVRWFLRLWRHGSRIRYLP